MSLKLYLSKFITFITQIICRVFIHNILIFLNISLYLILILSKLENYVVNKSMYALNYLY